MGKMQRDKGARFEREIVHKLEFHNIKAKREPKARQDDFRDQNDVKKLKKQGFQRLKERA